MVSFCCLLTRCKGAEGGRGRPGKAEVQVQLLFGLSAAQCSSESKQARELLGGT